MFLASIKLDHCRLFPLVREPGVPPLPVGYYEGVPLALDHPPPIPALGACYPAAGADFFNASEARLLPTVDAAPAPLLAALDIYQPILTLSLISKS